MAKTAWYAENMQRDYPFIERVPPRVSDDNSLTMSFDLPSSVFVEAGMIMDDDAEFVCETDSVSLYSISRDGDDLTFVFRASATGTTNYELVIYRRLTDPLFTISRAMATTIAAEPVLSLTCAGRPRWTAVVVTGDLSPLRTRIDDGETIQIDDALWQLEPARIQTLQHRYVNTVSLANVSRTVTTSPIGCSETGEAEQEVIIAAACLAGSLQVMEGYNCIIRQDRNDNALIIGAGVRAGAGDPCEEIPLYDDETAPDGSPYLSGGPGCHQVIRTINGVSAANLTITAGTGFQIQPHDDLPNRLVIDRTLDEFVLCDEALLSSIAASEEPDRTPVTSCDTLSTSSRFYVTVLNGLIASLNNNTAVSVFCEYNASLSINDTMVWTSESRTLLIWDSEKGTNCGIRWRAKLTCTGTSFICEVIGYPLADNTPCMKCYGTLGTPIPVDLSVTMLLAWSQLTADCPCMGPSIATSIKVEQI